MTRGGLRRAVLSVAVVVFISKALGFLREVVIAHRFGTSAEYDQYLIAVMLPALAYGVLNFAAYYLFVPYFTRKLAAVDRSENRATQDEIWPAVNLTIVIAAAVSIAIVIFSPMIMKIWARDYAAAAYDEIVFYSRITAVIVLLGTTEAFLRAFLNASRVFTYPAAGIIVFNFVSISSIVLLAGSYSVGAIAFGLIAGLVLQNVFLLVQWWKYRQGTAITLSLINEDTRAVLVTGGILVIIELVNRSYFLIDRYFAIPFGEGIISALNYSQVLVQLPDAIVGMAIGTVIFPLFSSPTDNQNPKAFGQSFRKATLGALILALPLAIIFLTNARDIVYLVFRRGEFDDQSLTITANVLRPYALSIAALFIVSTSIRACYSKGWGLTVLLFALVALIVKFVATALLSSWMAFPGISAATTAANLLFGLLLLALVIRRTDWSSLPSFKQELAFMIVAAVVCWVVTLSADYTLFSHWKADTSLWAAFRIAGLGIVTVASFLGMVWILGLRTALRECILGTRLAS